MSKDCFFLYRYLANIIMTQMESEIVKPLETKGVIKHYMRYVDDTLLLIKPENIETVLRKFNSFHKNLHGRYF